MLLPQEKSNSKLMQLLMPKEFIKDRYRLVFLDPVTGRATKCGPDGNGYVVELPNKWLVDNRKYINDGLKIAKLCAAAGQLAGLPLPSCAALPTSVVSKAEVQALNNFEALLGEAADVDAGSKGAKGAKGAKAATGKAYKQLRKVLKEQCNDEYLVQCSLKKARANDGSIEWVSEATKANFIARGQQCLVWNNASLKEKAATSPPPPPRDKGDGSDMLSKGLTVIELVDL